MTMSSSRAPTSSTRATFSRNRENSQTLGSSAWAACQPRVFREQLLEMMRDHRGAGAGRYHYVLRIAKDFQEMGGHLPRFRAIPAVEGRLPAAGLGFGKVHP